MESLTNPRCPPSRPGYKAAAGTKHCPPNPRQVLLSPACVRGSRGGAELDTLRSSGSSLHPKAHVSLQRAISPDGSSPKNCVQRFPAGPAWLHVFWKDGCTFRSSGGVCPHQRQWDPLVGGQGELLSAQTRLQRASQGSLLRPPAAGWVELPAGSWQNRALLARSTKWQTRTVPRNSPWIPVTSGSSQGGGLRAAPVKSPGRGSVGGTQAGL